MKTQSKPIVALASGAILLFGVLCQTTHAQAIIASNTVAMSDTDGNSTGPTALSVSYTVSYNSTSQLYTYDYIVSNPSGDYIDGDVGNPSDAVYVTSFEVSFNASPVGAVSSPTGGVHFQNDGPSGVTWALGGTLGPGDSANLSFQSDNAYDVATANSSGAPNPPAPWETLPGGPVVAPNPPVIPEPATTALFGLGLLFAAFRPNILKFKNS
jgi:hypothetical protein